MKRANKQGNRYYFRVTRNAQVIHSGYMSKLGRFSRIVQAEQFQEAGIEVYIRVSYGKSLDIWGEMTDFINEGFYSNKHDLVLAYRAFLEVGR